MLDNGTVQLLPVDDAIEISTYTSGEREILSNLTIIMADPSDAQPGVYVCIATNEPGQDTANAELTVHGKYFVNPSCGLTSSMLTWYSILSSQ